MTHLPIKYWWIFRRIFIKLKIISNIANITTRHTVHKTILLLAIWDINLALWVILLLLTWVFSKGAKNLWAIIVVQATFLSFGRIRLCESQNSILEWKWRFYVTWKVGQAVFIESLSKLLEILMGNSLLSSLYWMLFSHV